MVKLLINLGVPPHVILGLLSTGFIVGALGLGAALKVTWR